MSNNLKFVHPKAQKALKLAFKESNLKLVVVQTMSLGGNDAVKASAGTHNQAGTYRNLFGINIPYSSCIDLSVNQEATRISDGKAIKLDETHIKWVSEQFKKDSRLNIFMFAVLKLLFLDCLWNKF